MAKPIESNIALLANGWLKSYGLSTKLEQESLNYEIDKALKEYESKGSGKGGNRPDTKLILKDKNGNYFPILIEYKGVKNKLEKLDSNGEVQNKTAKNEPHYKNIKEYAVNTTVHYANAILHHTSYTDIIAIGMTGYKDASGNIQHQIAVYYIISIPSNNDVYRAYFQSIEFTVLSDAYAIKWIYDDVALFPNQYLFAVPSINKVTDLKIYSYKNKLGGWNVVKDKYIKLPIQDNQLDYKTMETLISAIKKLVIKDVVLYVEKR